MTTKSLHFKWTTSRGQDTYGYNICTLLVDGYKVGKCMGGGYDMQGTSFAQWIQSDYQDQLVALFPDEFKAMLTDQECRHYESKGQIIKHKDAPGYYGVTLYSNGVKHWVSMHGAAGFSSMERIAEAVGVKLKWNPESNKYKNHTYYTAIITNNG